MRTAALRLGLAACGLVLSAIFSHEVRAGPVTVAAGETLYRQGVTSSGTPLSARREPDLKISGADAACINCHRRSGLGEREGGISIPPISGIYLFHPRAGQRDDLDLPFVETMRPDRDPYIDVTLARAIRDGIGVDGHALNYLMPHYEIGDADLANLIAYLKGMTPRNVPGVSATVLHFATIITPDADPVKRQAMLDVLQRFFEDKNAFARAGSAHMSSSHRMMFAANRRWALHVWELTGPPGSWEAQLREHLAREPVLAVISGLGGRDWSPVHHFCEHAALPCLFPNVDLPVVAERDFYSVYYSKGVLLEAALVANRLSGARENRPARIVQVYRVGDIGESAARALRQALESQPAPSAATGTLIERPLGASAPLAALQGDLDDLGPQDALVLWLRPADLAVLRNRAPKTATVFVSGLMAGLDSAPLPPEWRDVTSLTYPFDLPEGRRIRMNYPLGWFRIRQIPVRDERVQADTFLACSVLAETLGHMSDSFIPDYLIERIEGMLEHRIITGYYPRLSLASGQRFASKGGYLVRLTAPSAGQVRAQGDWVVP